MRKIIWPPASEDPKKVPLRAWVLGWEALNSYPAGDNSQSRRVQRTMRAYETLGVESPLPGTTDGSTGWTLREVGGAMLLEEAEYQLLKDAIEQLRKRSDRAGNPVLTGYHVDLLLYLDDLLANALELPKEALETPPS